MLWEMQLDTEFEIYTKECLPIQRPTAVCCYGNKLQKPVFNSSVEYLIDNAHV